MSLAETIVAGAAGVLGALVGALLTARSAERTTRLQLEEQRRILLLQLQHDKLISIGDKISSVYLFTGYARRMAQWDQKRKDDFVALIDSLDDHVGIAGFHLPLLNVLGHFHTEVRQRSRAILRAIQDGDEKAFDKEMEGWTKKVGEQWEEVQAAIRNIVLSGEATTA